MCSYIIFPYTLQIWHLYSFSLSYCSQKQISDFFLWNILYNTYVIAQSPPRNIKSDFVNYTDHFRICIQQASDAVLQWFSLKQFSVCFTIKVTALETKSSLLSFLIINNIHKSIMCACFRKLRSVERNASCSPTFLFPLFQSNHYKFLKNLPLYFCNKKISQRYYNYVYLYPLAYRCSGFKLFFFLSYFKQAK